MGRIDKRNLIDRGRKAGLSTGELYRALSTQQPDANESAGGLPDSNGFVSEIDSEGHRVFKPLEGHSHR